MGGMVPLGDASRRPARVPIVTAGIIVVNVAVFVLELMRGGAFVTQWAAVPAQIVSGHHMITILTAMFMHGSWSHIIGNMIFLWAFAPEKNTAQVVQPPNIKIRTARKTMRTEGKSLQESKQGRIRPPCLPASQL